MNYSMFSEVREGKDTMDAIRKGPWTSEEDSVLMKYVSIHGEGRWNSLARSAGLKRTGKSCRLRWLNYLRPDVRRGNITVQEQLLIVELHSRFGNRWSKIAQYIPGRTDNEIKNYWRTKVQKHAKHLRCDVVSKSFRDAMRYIWMPRLMERISQSSSTPPGDTIINGQQPDIQRVIQGDRQGFNYPLGSSSSKPEISCCSSSGCCYSEVQQTHISSFDMRDFSDMGRSENYFEEFQYDINGVHDQNQQSGLLQHHEFNDDQSNAWIVEDSLFQDQLLNDEDFWILGQQL